MNYHSNYHTFLKLQELNRRGNQISLAVALKDTSKRRKQLIIIPPPNNNNSYSSNITSHIALSFLQDGNLWNKSNRLYFLFNDYF